jgi:hypothetical protein
MEYPKPSNIVIEDKWFGSRGIWQDRPILMRGRPNLTHIAGHPKYPKKLTIAWDYGDNGSTGMPTPEGNLEMEAFEERLLEALEKSNHAFAVAVVTTAGSREWVFYTQDGKESARRLNETFANEPRRPLRLEMVNDPKWAEYLGILKNSYRPSGEA